VSAGITGEPRSRVFSSAGKRTSSQNTTGGRGTFHCPDRGSPRAPPRYHHFGEGEYDDGEWMIQHLLSEAGGEGIDNELVSLAPDGFEAQADWTSLRSPDTYLGYEQGQNLDLVGSPGASQLPAPTDPGVTVSRHRALLTSLQ
jgi:hypothetical protein